MPLSTPADATLQTVQQGLSDITIAQESTSLTDLPAAWLLQLAPRLTPAACLSAFQTCNALRDLMLSQRHRVCVQFQLPLSPAAAAAEAALQRACQQCQAVVLICHARRPEAAASAQSLVTRTRSSLGHPLSAITTVELRGLHLEDLVPAWLQSACPNMTSLTLDACSISLRPDAKTNITACGQLRELCLLRPTQLGDLYQRCMAGTLQRHLLTLTGLLCLTVEGPTVQWHEHLVGCCSVLGTQITRLSCSPPDPYSNTPVSQLSAWFTNATELHVPSMRLADSDMEALLGMPSLKRLWFSHIQLEYSYADRPCGWTDIHFQVINMAELSRWPLAGKPALHAMRQVEDDKFCVLPGRDLINADIAAAAIRDCGGIQWGSVEHVQLRPAEPNDAAGEACLAVSLPILSGCHASRLTVTSGWAGVTLTPSLLAILQPHVASLPFTHVTLDCCTWAHPGVGALLLPSLPAHVHTVCSELGSRLITTEAHLTKVCVHAIRAVTVQVVDFVALLPEGWQQRVREAMRAAGNEHVTLV